MFLTFILHTCSQTEDSGRHMESGMSMHSLALDSSLGEVKAYCFTVCFLAFIAHALSRFPSAS